MRENILFNKTKIVATVGPACNKKEQLIDLVKAGVDVFRLNFSHGTHEDHQAVVEHINTINEELGTHITILQDLQGPKIRLRDVENGSVDIKKGDELIIGTEKFVGNAQKVSTTYTQIVDDVNEDDVILIDDGKIELRVKAVKNGEVITEVVYGGPLKSKKGINLPFTNVSAPSLTPKDIEDLKFGLKNDVEWMALSFVRKPEDVLELRKYIEEAGKQTKIVAKIEKPEAIKNIDEIIEVTDALMVARGDLGVEVHMEDVPLMQKMIVSKCNKACKPVIIATQMMESMIENPRPTRAETNDVANAVMDGADALMLSAETAAGKYPVETVTSMTKTIASIEQQGSIYDKFDHLKEDSPTYNSDSLVQTACRLAKETNAKAIVGMTKSGYTAFRLSSHRPKGHIFIFTDNKPLLETINLVWGVRGFYYDGMVSTDQTFADIEKILKENGHVEKDDTIILTASMPIKEKNRTNMLKVKVVD